MRLSLKNKFTNREPVFSGWTSLGHPQVTEMLARSNVDFVGIDIEHSTISQEQSQRIIAACHTEGVACLPRVATHNQEAIKRVLDSGADGVIVPTVERGFFEVVFCSMEMAGERPSIWSTSGFCIISRNWRA